MDQVRTQVIIKKVFFFQSGVGISANTLLLFLHILSMLQVCGVKPNELLTCHLALVHIVMLLVAMQFFPPNLFESLHFQRALLCKVLFFTHRVMRGLSICNTCLLSIYQAITIGPSTSWLTRVKHHFINHTIQDCLFLWSLNLLLSSDIIFLTVAYSRVNQTDMLHINKYCSISPMSSMVKGLFYTLTISRDIFFVGLMLISSAYMVVLLSRHRRRSQYLHSLSLSLRASPEQRATLTILMLVSVFVIMYWLNLIIQTFSTLLWTYNTILLSAQSLLLNAYATVCPVIQTASHKRIKDILQSIQLKGHQLFTR